MDLEKPNKSQDQFDLLHSLSTFQVRANIGQEFDSHTSRHIQTHLDKLKTKIPEKKTPLASITNIPEAMNRDLYKVFEKYNLGSKTMLCLWRNGQLNCA